MSWDLQRQLSELEAQGLRRELRVLDAVNGAHLEIDGRVYLNFSSNDYLGMAGSRELRQALQEGVARHGVGAGASRLVCGTWRPHAQLEEQLADFKDSEAALVFSSGFATAMGCLPALVGPGDTVILDKLCHASLVDGARLSGATLRVFPHNHLDKLERLLKTAQGRVLVVTESIFSMDGDAAVLRGIVELKDQYGAWLWLDEAHAVGVLGPQGRGLAAELGLASRVELQMGTLSKAFGLCGGYLAASRQVIDWLINRARSFIYSTAPPAALAEAAQTALALVRGPEGDRRREALRRNLETAHACLGLTTESAILPWIIGDETEAVARSAALREAGFLAPAIRYPTVARGSARLRLTLSAAHEPDQIKALAAALGLTASRPALRASTDVR